MKTRRTIPKVTLAKPKKIQKVDSQLELLGIDHKAITPNMRKVLVEKTIESLFEKNQYTQNKLKQFLAKLPAEQRAKIKAELTAKQKARLEIANRFLKEAGLPADLITNIPPEKRFSALIQRVNLLSDGSMNEMQKAEQIAIEVKKAMIKSGAFSEEYF